MKQMWDQYQLVCSKADTHSTLAWWTEQSRVNCLLTRFIHMVLIISLRMWAWQTVNVSEDPYKFGESLLAILVVCVKVDKYSHSAKKSLVEMCVCVRACVCVHARVCMFVGRQSWVSWQGTSQLTNTLGMGLDCMNVAGCQQWQLHPFVAANLTQVQTFAKRFTLLSFL
jgi:hypothetical protein